MNPLTKKCYALHFQVQTTLDSRNGKIRTMGTWLFNLDDAEATEATDAN